MRLNSTNITDFSTGNFSVEKVYCICSYTRNTI